MLQPWFSLLVSNSATLAIGVGLFVNELLILNSTSFIFVFKVVLVILGGFSPILLCPLSYLNKNICFAYTVVWSITFTRIFVGMQKDHF